MRLLTSSTLLFACLALIALQPLTASAQDRFPGESRGTRRGERLRQFAPRTIHWESIQKGFIIHDGTPLDAPFDLKWEGEAIIVNSQKTAVTRGHELRNIRNHLQINCLVFISGEEIEIIMPTSDPGILLLRNIAGRSLSQKGDPERLSLKNLTDKHREIFEQMRSKEFTENDSLRAAEVLDQIEDVETTNMSANHAVSRLDQLTYPLTMFGMVLTVIAFGHLISYHPEHHVAANVNPHPYALKMVTRSIIFVILLSALDLVWTILASQAGQMKELNPLASQFIDKPDQLLAFKATATIAGAGLLFFMKHYKTAQTASWWMCLVCTVLAFRWLTFNSMMLG